MKLQDRMHEIRLYLLGMIYERLDSQGDYIDAEDYLLSFDMHYQTIRSINSLDKLENYLYEEWPDLDLRYFYEKYSEK